LASPSQRTAINAIEGQVFEVCRELLRELGSYHVLESVSGGSRLDRDLGLGSLERVEFLARLERAFGMSFPDQTLAEAETLDDVVRGIVAGTARPGGSAHSTPLSSLPLEATETKTRTPTDVRARAERAPADDPLRTVETWQEVIRRRSALDGNRTHLIVWEDGQESRRVSFAELHTEAQAVAAGLAEHGITRGDSVALMLPTSHEFFLAFAGVLLAGAVPVPIYPPLRESWRTPKPGCWSPSARPRPSRSFCGRG